MALHVNRSMLAALAILAASACTGNPLLNSGGAVSTLPQASSSRTSEIQPADTTSILKKLTKDVVIGSAVDPSNGDKGPRAIGIAPCGTCQGLLQQGQLVFCNFENSAGTAGEGTTVEALDPTPGSSPTRFVQSDSIAGCDADAPDGLNYVYAGGLVSQKVVEFADSGKLAKTYSGKTVAAPFSDVSALPLQAFSPNFIFIGTTSGGLVNISAGFYGNGIATQVAKGFAVNKSTGWGQLGPSGLQYNPGIDTLYIVDGVNNTIVAFSGASNLLDPDEITVEPGGTTFKCRHPKVTCGSLVYSGSPLDAPVASALLPNGNLIVANTQGTANTLVELTPQGQVLDTKVVDKSSTEGVYGLIASGTSDSTTVLYFTDTNSNSVHELEQ